MAKLKKSKFVNCFIILLMCALLVGSAGDVRVYAADYVAATTIYVEVRFSDGTSEGQSVAYNENGTTFTYTSDSKTITDVVVSQSVTGSFEVGSKFTTYFTVTPNFDADVSIRHLLVSAGESIGSNNYIALGNYLANNTIRVDVSSDIEESIEKISTNVKLSSGTLEHGFTVIISNIHYDYQVLSSDSQTSKGILDTVKGIFTSITNLPAKIKESLSSLFQDLQDAVVALASNIAYKFTAIFDGWYDTDVELDESLKDSWEIGSGLEVDESELINNALSDINHIDFVGGFTGELVTALLWLLPFQDRLYNSLGLVKDVIVVALTIGLVTLVLGRGLRTLANYGGKK